MWLPKNLILKNFISHLDSSFEFKAGKAIMIQGINSDDDSQESNGSGKSAIIEGTIFSLTGDSFRKVRAVDLIMNDEQTASTEITLENSISKQLMVISRELDRKKGSVVTVTLNGEQKVLPSVNDYNKFVLEALDISKEDLMNYFVVSKEKYQSFLLAGDTKKKEIIARFSNSNMIDGIDKIVEKDATVFTDQIQKLELKKSKLEGQIEIHKEQLENQSTQEDFDLEIKSKVVKFNQQITDIETTITGYDKTIESHEDLLIETRKKLKGFSVDDLTSKLKAAEKDENKLIEIGQDLKETVEGYEELIATINKNLAGSVQCPKCEHEFVVTNPEFEVEKAKEELEPLKIELVELKTDLKKSREDYRAIESKKNEIKAEIRKVEQLKHQVNLDISKIENEIENVERNKRTSLSQIKNVKQQIDSLKSMKFESNESAVREKIEIAEEEIITASSEILELETKKQKLIEWVYVFKKFKTHLTNKSINSIEAFTNMFLTKIKTNLAVKMDGYKLLSDGKTIRENITVDILRNGLVEGPIEKFSGGEKVRVDICNILALQKLINLNSNSGGLDLLLLDEIIESVDSVGVSEILRQLNSINQTISIITHANTIRDYENVVIVTKENGYSNIKQYGE